MMSEQPDKYKYYKKNNQIFIFFQNSECFLD